jgi:eukaryotic-like serine/threonine-protein kinase
MLIRKRVDNLMNDDSNREVVIFTQALKFSPRARAAFLEQACEGDDGLRGKVEALLKAHDRLGSFLEEPPRGLADDWDDAHE